MGEDAKRPDTILKAAQALATIGGLIGAVWMYFDFRQDQETAKTDLMWLQNEQANLNIQQQKVAFGQAQLAAATEQQRSQVAVKQQALALEQSRLTADSEVAQKKLSVELMRLEKGLKTSDLNFVERGRISYSTDLDANCGTTPGQYDATYAITIRNTSKKDVLVAWTLLNRFLGSFSSMTEPEQILQINPPPSPIVGFRSVGPIEWQEKGYTAYNYPGAPNVPESYRYRFISGGGSTKVLRSGDAAVANYELVVVAPEGQWLGVNFSWGIDEALAGDDLFHERNWIQLPPCDRQVAATQVGGSRQQNSDPDAKSGVHASRRIEADLQPH